MSDCCCGCGAKKGPLFKGAESVPGDAIILFDGKDFSGWVKRDDPNAPAEWNVGNGYVEVVPRTGDVHTKELFTDCQVHVEFWLPLMADKKGQARSNSGVYLQGRYEVQVLDSYELDSQHDDCGGIYRTKAPCVNACRPPEQWQTYEIFFKAPRYNEHGVKRKNARISVLQNGVWVQHDVDVHDPTGGELDHEYSQPGPLLLQDHGNLVRYRNIWARKL